jgi:hypothetical protein
MDKIFGDFIDRIPETEHEFLRLGFSPSSVPIQQRWRNNGLSADFIADYLVTFFPTDQHEPDLSKDIAEVKSAVNYIANELLENAMKYNYEPCRYPIKLDVDLFNGDDLNIVICVSNSVDPLSIDGFQVFINEFINTNTEEFYLKQIEKSAADQNDRISGMGLITMKNDYGAKLGWKFETIKESSINVVTTMIQLRFSND